MSRDGRPRVVIVGAGFGGLWAAKALAKEPVDVLLLDRNNYHAFLPLLYQVAAAELGPTEIAYPVRSIFRGVPNVRFRMAEVREVDFESREVCTSLERISYDHLILALGSTPHFFGIEGAEEHSFPLRTMREAIPLRHRILSCFEAAVYEEREERRRRLLTFTVVGGGPTGVEFAGALAELVYGPLRSDYPGIDPGEPRIVLLEAMDRLLPGTSEKMGRYARERLEKRGVAVRTGAMVERIQPGLVELSEGEPVVSDTVAWTAGVQGHPAAGRWGLETAKSGRIRVEDTMQAVGRPEVYVVGDLAYVEDEAGDPLPQVAPAAIQEAEHAAANILRSVRDERLEPFEYDDPGMLAVIGRNSAAAEIGGRTFTGFFAWMLWLSVHIFELIGFRNRMLVLINWAWNYISYERAVRLILPFGEGTDYRSAIEEELEEPGGPEEVEAVDEPHAGEPSDPQGEEPGRPEEADRIEARDG